MKAFISRRTARIELESTPDYMSPHMILFGRIDRLHISGGAIWNPDLSQIEKYLAQNGSDSIIKNIPCIEGQYLIIWCTQGKVCLFCDRYCINAFYYRVSSDTIEVFDHILAAENNLAVSQSTAISFLLFGYVPGRQTLFQDISRIMPGECLVLDITTGEFHIDVGCVYPKTELDEDRSDDQAAEKFHSLFREALEKRISQDNSSEPLLLPISGGLDSRYVLGTALELVSPSRLIAMTFGQKGSYDFEIGKLVAEAAGVPHMAYPLCSDNYDAKSLEANCLDTDGQVYFTSEAPIEIYENFAEYGKITLSGYVGDAIMGNKLHLDLPTSREAIVFSDAKVGIGDPLGHYLDNEAMQSSFYYDAGFDCPLDLTEMWFFINHFTKYTTHCVFKHRDHFTYICPFVDYAFIDYVLNLPPRMRLNRSLYFSWLRKHFKALSDLPCNTYCGVPLSASPLKINLAHQWDRILHYGLGMNRRVNKLDLFRHRRQVLGSDISRYHVYSTLPPDFARTLNHSKYYLLHYSLKCLEVLHTEYNVNFH
jgi:hypothetical protein